MKTNKLEMLKRFLTSDDVSLEDVLSVKRASNKGVGVADDRSNSVSVSECVVNSCKDSNVETLDKTKHPQKNTLNNCAVGKRENFKPNTTDKNSVECEKTPANVGNNITKSVPKAKESNKNIHSGHRARLREVVEKRGLDGMPEHQVLEYMLSFVVPQKDTNVIAHNLIKEFGSLGVVLETNQKSLAKVNGVGEVVSHFLANFRNMFAYYQNIKAKSITTINNSKTAINYLKLFLHNKLVEELCVVGLNNKNQVIFSEKVGNGTVNKNDVSIRDITELVVRHHVSDIIIGHNHPKGKAVPSPEDDAFTRALACAMVTMNVSVLDHIIIGETDHYSYFQNNFFAKLQQDFGAFLNKSFVAQNHARYME